MGRLVSYLPTALEEAHEIDVSPNGRREVKYPFAFKDLDWEAYHRFRPFYPDSMFNMWQVYLISYLLPYPSVSSMVSWVRCQSTLLDISQWVRLGGAHVLGWPLSHNRFVTEQSKGCLIIGPRGTASFSQLTTSAQVSQCLLNLISLGSSSYLHTKGPYLASTKARVL